MCSGLIKLKVDDKEFELKASLLQVKHYQKTTHGNFYNAHAQQPQH